MSIFLSVVDKMAIAALQSETIRQIVKPIDEVYDRYVNHVISEIAQSFLFLRLKMGIFRYFF